MGFKAKDIMTTPFISVHRDASVDDALARLLRHHVSGLPVVDDDGQLEGIITEHDLLKLLYESRGDSDRVSDYLTRDIITVNEDDSLPDIAEQFLSLPIRRLPVLRDGKVVGIIARRDLVRYIHETRIRVAEELETRRRQRCDAV